MIRLLYNLIFPIIFLLALPGYLLRMLRRGNFRNDFAQRFAHYSPNLRSRFSQGKWIWVHAVSVGELLAALKFINELHARHPDLHFVVSNTTSTAHAIAISKKCDWLVPVYTPLDLLSFVRRALRTIRPKVIVLTESEMWPNFIWSASKLNIPVLLVNARVSPRSEMRYRKFAPIVRHITRHLAAVGLQEPNHADLWQHLGIPANRLHLTGSVKYDPGTLSSPQNFLPILAAWGILPNTPILLAGSTHDGEEKLLAEALHLIRNSLPDARLLIAPRHIERTPAILSQLAGSPFHIARRTSTPDGSNPDILIIDTTGELRDWYSHADVVFIGKSLTGHGGQNPAEPILAGRPVLFGPHMENFATLVHALLSAHGAIEIHDAPSLAASATALFNDPAQRATISAQAARTLAPHLNATHRTADLIESFL